jgi:Undecaprenyl-phosphate glucose phosphotransferase
MLVGIVGFGGGASDTVPFTADYFYLLLFTTIMWTISAEHLGVTSVAELFRENTGIRAAAKACAYTYLMNFAALFFVRQVSFSRVFLAASAAVLFLAALLMRAAFRGAVRAASFVSGPARVLMIGADAAACRAIRRINATQITACVVVGAVRLRNQHVKVSSVPVYDLADIERLEKLNFDEIIIAVPQDRYGEIAHCRKALEELCRPIRVVIDIGEKLKVRDRIFHLNGLQMLDLDASPTESLPYSLGKRAFDVVFSATALALLSPVMVLIAVLVKMSSRGPVFFKQERVGLYGETFWMYKFRTMRVAATAESDTVWTTDNDPRKTWLGSFLRRTSLDELPQFINVLKGDMSIVGPRPERPYYVNKFRQEFTNYHARHRLKVGITGWAQVNGWRGDTSIQKRLQCDLYYLQNWSVGLDLRIVFMTLWSGLVNKNAY